MKFHIRQIYQRCGWQERKGGSVAMWTYVSVLLFSSLFRCLLHGIWWVSRIWETFFVFDNLLVTFPCNAGTLYLPWKFNALCNHSVIFKNKRKKRAHPHTHAQKNPQSLCYRFLLIDRVIVVPIYYSWKATNSLLEISCRFPWSENFTPAEGLFELWIVVNCCV